MLIVRVALSEPLICKLEDRDCWLGVIQFLQIICFGYFYFDYSVTLYQESNGDYLQIKYGCCQTCHALQV